EEELDAGGYRITTTLQKNKQNAFVDAVNDKLADAEWPALEPHAVTVACAALLRRRAGHRLPDEREAGDIRRCR
ncbi:hypothetical protein ABZ590_39020, partial [Streptomyces hirsutus]|uniref:hypothetical protein n=1 Tax=Streptomyces hirsutus TaxID=35620 RepID=UPI0033D372F7